MLKVYNSLTHQIEEFKPNKEGEVKLYSCGPTVYNYIHIGNLRAFIFVDLLKRYLKYSGYDVKHVMNITDVDDKTIKRSQQSGKGLAEVTEFYTQAFLTDIETLNIQKPDLLVKATEHIDEMIELTKKLLARGYAYKSNGSTYFKISSFPNYGQLANIEKQDLKVNAGGRLHTEDEYEKEDVSDFALWKAWDESDGNIFWDTELGKGRPGWHIECSAMAMKYLGENFDIHCGGIDLLFPHHTNEIAQSEAATGSKFVNYWLHNAHLLVDGQKMSKKLNNYYTLSDMIEHDFSPLYLRILLIKINYRQPANFTWDGMNEAKAIATRFNNFLNYLDHVSFSGTENVEQYVENARTKFKSAMDDDLNTSAALATMFEFIDEVSANVQKLSNKSKEQIYAFINEIDQVFGFIMPLYEIYKDKLSKVLKDPGIQVILSRRQEYRAQKDFTNADKLRDELSKKGLGLQDTPTGYIPWLIH